jgi:hypothetical protein
MRLLVSLRTHLAVEQLEDRRLPSVAVTPLVLSAASVRQGSGVFTVRLLDDDPRADALLVSPSPLRLFATDAGVTRSITKSILSTKVVQGDGVARVQRSALRRLAPGFVTLTITNGSVSESGVVILLPPPRHPHRTP